MRKVKRGDAFASYGGYLYVLNDYPIHEEMETCYEREYWLRKHQWAKLSEADQIKAADLYKIMAPDMLIN